jgi:hypothetical protein
MPSTVRNDWPDLEPQRGVFAPNWLASYEQLFKQLPAGTKVIIDVVDSPQWETGTRRRTSTQWDPSPDWVASRP